MIRAAIVALLIGVYPAFVLGYTWSHVLRSELPGGSNGPLDAYRHTLASAVVAYTLNERAVEWATLILEMSDTEGNRMDRHNNRIGAKIGARARSFSEVEPAVAAQVAKGAVDSYSGEQVTWLPRERWRRGRLW